MNYSSLWSELVDNPAGLAYADPTDPANDTANTDLINAESQTVPRTTITAEQLWENTDLTEYAALTGAERQAYSVLVDLGTIDVAQGTNSRAALAALFPAGSDTRTNLLALVQQDVTTSRAAILGLERVYAHHVATARERFGA